MAEGSADDLRSLVGRLFDQHGASLYRYALMLLADPPAAEDAVQQVFAALLRLRSARLENERHYLRRAVRNECYSMLRRRRVHESATEGKLIEPIAAASPDVERVNIERALRALPPEQREVVHLHVFEGMTFQEIADGSGESINTIASRYRYALAKLRELLTP